MNYNEIALEKHKEWKGKISVEAKCPLVDRNDLSIAYTPGVAAPCLEIQKDLSQSYEYTGRGNLVAVVTDGTAVLGLGDIGPEAGMPVMEGKCVLFKAFADVDAFPLCIRSKDVDEIVRTIELLQGSFGGINLEDIAAPRCFEIEEKLKQKLDIPVFHDDQHGTAVVVLSALINALKIVDKKIDEISIVINGAGAAGIAIAKLLMHYGVKNITLVDINGTIYEGRDNLSDVQVEMAKITNRKGIKGGLQEAIVGADVFVGVSAPNCLKPEMIKTMNSDAIVFAMANPTPEIFPEDALKAGARIVGTGRSDYPNQINNVLVFPGLFRGTLDVRAKEITNDMKIAAAIAIASYIKEEDLSETNIIPIALDKNVSKIVAEAVANAVKK
ncbi:MAG: NADP-dependent malic enzyme [Clostridia bacterium]